MLRGQKLPPAAAFTLGDKLRLASGALILLLGFALFWRLLPLGINLQTVLVSIGFIGFGIYRLGLGYSRWKEYAHLRASRTSK